MLEKKGGNIERFNLCDNIICNSNKNKLCVENVSLIETVYGSKENLLNKPSGEKFSGEICLVIQQDFQQNSPIYSALFRNVVSRIQQFSQQYSAFNIYSAQLLYYSALRQNFSTLFSTFS